MYSNWYYLFVLGSSIFPLLALFFKTQIGEKFNLTFIIFLFVRFLSDFICLFFEHLYGNSNPVFYFSLFVQYLLIIELFYLGLQIKKFKPHLILLGILLFTVDFVINKSFFYNNYISTVYSYTIFSALGWYYLYNGIKIELYRNVLIPITLFYTPLFFYSIFENKIDNSESLYKTIFFLFSGLTLLLNIFFARAVWLMKKN
jgi:hypothetical protein